MFYDTHAHLDYPDFREDLDQVIIRAREAGITRMISIGTNLESSERAVRLAELHPEIFAAVGWHPGDAMEAPDDIRPELRSLAVHPKVVAIGETGLDYYRLPSRSGGSAAEDSVIQAKQAALFAQQLEVAAEFGLNCVIHTRDSFSATIEQFGPWAARVRAVFHCFVGRVVEMEQVLALGSLVSFTGITTFKNGQSVRETLAATPLGKFMLETDAPFLAPVPFRGKRCEPAHVKETAAMAAQVKQCSLEELTRATCDTAHAFFPKLRPN